MLYGAESWPIDAVAQMTKLINLFETSAYHIITGVKRLDKVHNTTVLATVSRNDPLHTVYDHQLRFLGHMRRGTYSPHARTYALYQLTHGSTRCSILKLMDYIQKLTGLKIDELVEASEDRETWHELVFTCVGCSVYVR